MTERINPPQAQADDELRFVRRVKQELDRSCAALDGATQSRLNAMRHAVLAQGQRKRSAVAWLPLGGLATACMLVLAVMLQPLIRPGVVAPAGTAPIEDLDLLTAVEELDFYEEYEFYQWLATSDTGPR